MRELYSFSVGICFLFGCANLSFAQSVKTASLNSPGGTQEFRNSPWGATETQVKKIERLKFTSGDSRYLDYHGKVLGYEASVTYNFYKGRLYRGIITFETNDGNSSIVEFREIRNGIESVFGKAETELHWSNPALAYSASDHEDQWGEAVSQGYLTMDCTWTSGSLVSALSLSGGGDVIHLKFVSQNDTLAPPKPSAEGEF